MGLKLFSGLQQLSCVQNVLSNTTHDWLPGNTQKQGFCIKTMNNFFKLIGFWTKWIFTRVCVRRTLATHVLP